MRSHTSPLLTGFAMTTLAVMTMLATPAAATDDPRIQDKLGWHTVQPGETFQAITQRYLGTPHLWRENWKLNPQIKDPGLLRAGQRLRVIVERQLPARRAVIEEVSNVVDKRLQRGAWQAAASGDPLAPRDGVRTAEQASTRLGFDEGSELTVSELSQIYLKGLDSTVRGVKRGSIEIEKGQADLLLAPAQPRKVNIEIVVGDAVTRPRPGPNGRAETRSRRPEAGGAQLMVYGGSSQIEAGGSTVEVPRGMGTSVPEGGAPLPPEKLLPAPVVTSPTGNPSFGYSNPRFAWRPVAGAASYTFEVCLDPGCAQLVRRVTGLTSTQWQPEQLPAAPLHWRVTAVSASGLDGYASRGQAFAIESELRDLEPPIVVAILLGEGASTAPDTFVVGAGSRLRLAARDDASGTAEIRYRWLDESTADAAWQRWAGQDLAPPPRDAKFEFEATDHLGQTSQRWRVNVMLDSTAPAAPTVSRQDL
ncbi:MAG: LysM peptidoglycan-binding domain-containing protein [Acidobacteriota bacterium]